MTTILFGGGRPPSPRFFPPVARTACDYLLFTPVSRELPPPPTAEEEDKFEDTHSKMTKVEDSIWSRYFFAFLFLYSVGRKYTT